MMESFLGWNLARTAALPTSACQPSGRQRDDFPIAGAFTVLGIFIQGADIVVPLRRQPIAIGPYFFNDLIVVHRYFPDIPSRVQIMGGSNPLKRHFRSKREAMPASEDSADAV